MGARHTIVEVEEIVPAGELPPDQIHTPGVYVERLVKIPANGYFRMERPAAAAEPAAAAQAASSSNGKRKLTRDEITDVIARRLPRGWTVNLGVGIPTLVSNYVRPDQEIVFTSENGVIGYATVAEEGEIDADVVNAGGQFVTLNPSATFVHHADSFALIRRGMNDVTVLGAYEVATDGSFANWRTSMEPFDQLGGIGGAMDLAQGAKEVWLAMEHTTREGAPRLLERCALPVTGPGGVTLVVTDLAVVAVRDGRFILEEHAPGYTVEEIRALTGAPLDVSPTLKEVAL
jgi:3-oxoacid CoA-transferase B subunit